MAKKQPMLKPAKPSGNPFAAGGGKKPVSKNAPPTMKGGGMKKACA